MYLALALLAAAPVFTAGRVLPSNSDRPAPLGPGLLFSIYGHGLGPQQGCVGHADTKRTQKPNPAVVMYNFAGTLIYPTELCEVQVFVGDKVAGLLWAQEGQINFQVPNDVPLEVTAPLRVVYQGVSSAAVPMKISTLTAELVVEGPVTTTSPVWMKVLGPAGAFPEPHYPFRFGPSDFGCFVVEVRRQGILLPLRKVDPVMGFVGSGPLCGSIGLSAPEPPRNRLPLHLAYRFDQPGTYEVRLSYKREYPDNSPITRLSPWTAFEVRPGTEEQRRQWLTSLKAPTEAGLLVTDYIPSLLGFADAPALSRLMPLLYDADSLVRQFAMYSLGFWPRDQREAALRGALKDRGPTDMIVFALRDQVDPAQLVPYLQSPDPVLLRGAILGLRGRPAAAEALVAAHHHVLAVADSQTQVDYFSTLGSVPDPRAVRILWSVAESRSAASEQALIAITWHKDPKDLPRLAAVLDGAQEGVPLTSLPYALRNSYGDAALPYLERVLDRSAAWRVRVACARELILARRAKAFAFVADAIENNRPYRGEVVRFVREQIPELRAADDAAVLAWVKQHAM